MAIAVGFESALAIRVSVNPAGSVAAADGGRGIQSSQLNQRHEINATNRVEKLLKDKERKCN
jgi:hypothetical protein